MIPFVRYKGGAACVLTANEEMGNARRIECEGSKGCDVVIEVGSLR